MSITKMVSVLFLDDFNEKLYDYLLLPAHESVKVGDLIVVPVKTNNHPTVARVIGFKSADDRKAKIPYKITMSLMDTLAYDAEPLKAIPR
jgi:hypothetical protein